MSEYISWLVTVLDLDTKTLCKCALKMPRDQLSDDCLEFYMEPENREKIWSHLPLHIQSIGYIVDIDIIDDVMFSLRDGLILSDLADLPAEAESQGAEK